VVGDANHTAAMPITHCALSFVWCVLTACALLFLSLLSLWLVVHAAESLAHRSLSRSVCYAVYELFQSLTRMDSEYTYDIYTAVEHQGGIYGDEKKLAVGITHGMAAVDEYASSKARREQHFPIELIQRGITFRCENGNASVESDKRKIIAEIGAGATLLNDTVHGVVAAAALERVLKENSDSRHEFLEAVKRSPPRELRVELTDSAGDTQENVTAVIEALAANGASKCEKLDLYSDVATEIPSCLGELTALKTLRLSNCSSLVSLPESMGQMTALETLKLVHCSSLVSLPESMGQLTVHNEGTLAQ